MRRESLHLRLGAHPLPCLPWSIHRGQATRVSNTSPDTPGVRSPRVPEGGGYVLYLGDRLHGHVVFRPVYSGTVCVRLPSYHDLAFHDVFRYKCETSLVRTSAELSQPPYTIRQQLGTGDPEDRWVPLFHRDLSLESFAQWSSNNSLVF